MSIKKSGKVKEYWCTKCDRWFKTKAELTAHNKKWHIGKKPKW